MYQGRAPVDKELLALCKTGWKWNGRGYPVEMTASVNRKCSQKRESQPGNSEWIEERYHLATINKEGRDLTTERVVNGLIHCLFERRGNALKTETQGFIGSCMSLRVGMPGSGGLQMWEHLYIGAL